MGIRSHRGFGKRDFRKTRLHIAVFVMPIAVTCNAIAAPVIRTSSANQVPRCVTSDRLMAFLKSRNPDLHPRYSRIAEFYAHWGEAWRVRWDYAFFQMMLETNALTYRRPDGRRGDVHESQNNFAGIGATGGGVPGERFPDISSGVHAQIQHLVAYSGVPIRSPVAARTAKVQQYIVSKSHSLGRPVTFADLAGRWAVDRHYGRSIEAVARLFDTQHCRQHARVNFIDIPLPVPRPRVAVATLRTARSDMPEPSYLGGPRPSFLAGPDADETLPWRALPKFQTGVKPAAFAGAMDNPARHDAPSPAPKPNGIPPWRTIWTREAGPATEHTPRTRTIRTGELTTAPPPAPARVTAQDVRRQNENGWGSFQFPWFKIAPAEPEPSRLGGPVPSSPEVPLSNQTGCRVLVASYGGSKTLLLKSNYRGEMRLTALTVLDGFEKSMFETYTRATAPDAEVIGSYDSAESALNDARTNCSTSSSD